MYGLKFEICVCVCAVVACGLTVPAICAPIPINMYIHTNIHIYKFMNIHTYINALFNAFIAALAPLLDYSRPLTMPTAATKAATSNITTTTTMMMLMVASAPLLLSPTHRFPAENADDVAYADV